jgi:hypothetical protein
MESLVQTVPELTLLGDVIMTTIVSAVPALSASLLNDTTAWVKLADKATKAEFKIGDLYYAAKVTPAMLTFDSKATEQNAVYVSVSEALLQGLVSPALFNAIQTGGKLPKAQADAKRTAQQKLPAYRASLIKQIQGRIDAQARHDKDKAEAERVAKLAEAAESQRKLAEAAKAEAAKQAAQALKAAKQGNKKAEAEAASKAEAAKQAAEQASNAALENAKLLERDKANQAQAKLEAQASAVSTRMIATIEALIKQTKEATVLDFDASAVVKAYEAVLVALRKKVAVQAATK